MANSEHPVIGGFMVGSILITSVAEHLVDALGEPEQCECVHGLVLTHAWLAERFAPDAVAAIEEAMQNSGATCDHLLVGLSNDMANIGREMVDSDVRVVQVVRRQEPTPAQAAIVAAILAGVLDDER